MNNSLLSKMITDKRTVAAFLIRLLLIASIYPLTNILTPSFYSLAYWQHALIVFTLFLVSNFLHTAPPQRDSFINHLKKQLPKGLSFLVLYIIVYCSGISVTPVMSAHTQQIFYLCLLILMIIQLIIVPMIDRCIRSPHYGQYTRN